MSWRTRALGALAICLVVAVASGCEGFLFNLSGKVTVTNTSATETAVIAVLGDDFKSYPTLGPGASATITTSVGGSYRVIVVMSAADAQTYRNNLRTLRSNVEKVIDGTASVEEKVRYFTLLAGIKSAITQAEAANSAGCSGSIKLDTENSASVTATVNWTTTLGSGFWDATCGSN